jgi:UMF1 family MFS transporter
MSSIPAVSERSALEADVRPREVWGWAMYDFANSGYTTVVITAVFNAYFVSVVAGGAHWATFAWTAALSVSYLLIMLAGPLVGAYADAHAAKKKLLVLTTAGCVLGTALLALAGPGQLALACLLIVFSNFFFGTGENLVAAFLPELARGKSLGKVSSWGWSLGYLGGLLSLGVCLAYVTAAQAQGQGASQFVPVTMLITAGIFALASLPTFLFLRERAQPQKSVTGLYSQAFRRVLDTLQHARSYRDLGRFLACIVLYQSGVSAVVALAAIYAEQAMKFSTRDTLLLILVVNITASFGALAFGYLQDRIGHIRAIALTLAGWCAMVLIAWSSTTPAGFWVAANVAGICMGASQSAGRALVGFLSPATRRAEFFGLWGFAVKLASILGPLTYGVVTWVTGSDHRLAMLITGVFFVLGLFVLLGIDVRRGRRTALREERKLQKRFGGVNGRQAKAK